MSGVCPVDRFRYPAPEVLEQPYEFYRDMRESTPVYRVPGTDVFIVSRYEDVLTASQKPDIFSSKREWMASSDPEVARIRAEGFPDSNSLTATDPPEHARFRALANKVFSPRRFASLEPEIRICTNHLVDQFIGKGAVDLQVHYAIPLPLYVIADLLALPHADVGDLKRWSDDYSEAIASGSRPLSRERAVECAQSLTDMQLYFSDKIKEREAAPGNDTISELIRANAAIREPVDHAELVDLLRIFLIGGNETTALAIGSMMYRLLSKPETYAALKDNPALITKAIEEGLRFESPAQWSGRNTTEDTELAGVKIPAGSRVYLNWGSANRDAQKFHDRPETFDPARENPVPHVAFGFGPHFCVGSPLARLELKITLEVFLARLKNLRLSAGNESRFMAHPILRGIEHLHVEFEAG